MQEMAVMLSGQRSRTSVSKAPCGKMSVSCILTASGNMQILGGGGRSHPPEKCTHVTESLSLPQTDQFVTWNILATILHQYVKCKSKLFSFTTLLTPKAWGFFTLNSILTRTPGLAKTLQVEGSVP